MNKYRSNFNSRQSLNIQNIVLRTFVNYYARKSVQSLDSYLNYRGK